MTFPAHQSIKQVLGQLPELLAKQYNIPKENVLCDSLMDRRRGGEEKNLKAYIMIYLILPDLTLNCLYCDHEVKEWVLTVPQPVVLDEENDYIEDQTWCLRDQVQKRLRALKGFLGNGRVLSRSPVVARLSMLRRQGPPFESQPTPP